MKMTAPVELPSVTKNFSLPFLFSGQAQKEFKINQSLAIIDTVLQQGVSGSLSTPPVSPDEGDCYRILSPADGAWIGQEEKLAVRVGDAWHFVEPFIGFTIFDRGTSSMLHFNNGWQSASEPSMPSGGDTVDTQARAAISDLIQALRKMGIF